MPDVTLIERELRALQRVERERARAARWALVSIALLLITIACAWVTFDASLLAAERMAVSAAQTREIERLQHALGEYDELARAQRDMTQKLQGVIAQCQNRRMVFDASE